MGDIPLAHFGLLRTKLTLNATAYLRILADCVHPFMTTVCPFSNDYFQKDKVLCHKPQIILN